MNLFDKAKDHADELEKAVDKAADVVDDQTGHKHSDQIDKAAEAAKQLGKLGGDDAPATGAPDAPSAAQTPPAPVSPPPADQR